MSLKVENLSQFKSLSSSENGDFIDFFVLLGGGIARSSKRVIYHSDIDEFYIINEIDESYQEVKTSDLSSETILIEAIQKGALFKF